MSLKIAAEHLKSKGRGSDTELIHMTKGEIKGLRQLAQANGGDLTINPETGLPEAGFLSKVLPVVAAAAATYFTAGAAAGPLAAALEGTAMAGYGGLLAGAGAGALIGGASSAIQGGDVGKGALFGGLGGALSGGLGAYDASPALDPSLINPETGEVLRQVAGPGVPMPQPTSTPFTPMPTPEAAPFQVAGPGMPMNSIPTPPSTSGSLNPRDVEAQMGGFYGGQAPANPYTNMTNPQITAATGIQPPPAAPASYYSGLGSGMSDMAKKAAILAAPGIAAQYGIDGQDNSGQVPTGESSSTLAYLSPNFQAQVPAQPNPYYTAQYPDYKKRPYTGMAGGGAIAFKNRGIVDLPRSSGADVGTYSDADPNTRNLDAYNAALYKFNKVNKKAGIKAPVQFKQAQTLGDVEEAASGGIMRGIGGYSDGGRMLKGPGDGMSDSIPAVIGSKQPARLADGEFVVPADVVSHLGNGSTDAGAKRLYGMMDNIRKARTGKKKQAPEVKVNKFLPA
jgi:hypothetical protein